MSRRATRSSGQPLTPINSNINRRRRPSPSNSSYINFNGIPVNDRNVQEYLNLLRSNVRFGASIDAGYLGCERGPTHAMRIEMTAKNLKMPKSRVLNVLSEYLKLTAAQIRTTKCARIPKIGVVGARVRSYLGEQKYRAGLRAPVLSEQLQNKLTGESYGLRRSERTLTNIAKRNKQITNYMRKK
jgi:hypothetical protein